MNGTCTYANGRFVVDLKPHVALRFKGVFRSIRSWDRPPFELVDRPDMAADLEWFFARYPVDHVGDSERRIREGKERYEAGRRQAQSILSGDMLPRVTGFREGRSPYGYQAKAAELAKLTGRLLLLDDVGLGKTVSALAMIADGQYLPAVVVTPSHVSGQWIDEYIRVFTRLAAYEVRTTRPEPLPPADVYVFRYSQLGGWATHAQEIGHRAIIFDEIQELRHGTRTGKGSGARAFCDGAELRVGLTATPIYNYGSEIFNIVDYLAPGVLGSWEEFLVQWCTSHGNHWVVREPDVLGAYLRDEMIALRRTEADEEVATQLPPLNRLLYEVEWNAGDAASDFDLQRQLAKKVVSGSFTERGQAARELDLLMRQMTGVAKARAAAAYARMLVEAGEPVVLAGWHREVYDIWQRMLSDLRPVMYTGSETAAQKAHAKRAFIERRSPLMIMSLRSGAGTDGLQDVSAHIVLGELDWSPQVHGQIIGRLRRPGQTRQVTAHFLWVNGGSDPVMMELNGLKASQSHAILDPYGQPVAAIGDDTRMRKLANAILEAAQ